MLAEQFTEIWPFSVAWHRVEEQERDVPKLFAHSLAALSALSPEIRSLPRPIDASPGDLAARIEAYLQDAAQPPGLQRFLLISSVLQKITPELCQDALQLINVNSYLSQIAARNPFLSQTDGGVAYHALFRDFLQANCAK